MSATERRTLDRQAPPDERGGVRREAAVPLQKRVRQAGANRGLVGDEVPDE